MKKILSLILLTLVTFFSINTTYSASINQASFLSDNSISLLKNDGAKTIYNSSEKNSHVCDRVNILRFIRAIHIVVNIMKILVPIALIIIGSITLGKAAIGGEQDALSKAMTSLIKKTVIGLVIFLVPTFVNVFIKMINDDKDFSGFSNCETCLSENTESCDLLIDALEQNSSSRWNENGASKLKSDVKDWQLNIFYNPNTEYFNDGNTENNSSANDSQDSNSVNDPNSGNTTSSSTQLEPEVIKGNSLIR